MSDRPSVLILGGVGMIGRNLTAYLVENNLCSKIRVVDKMIPIISYCSEEHKAALDTVEFSQCDLAQDSHVERAFKVDEGEKTFDIVINLAAETRFGLEESMYKQKCLDLSIKCAHATLKMGGCKKYIEVSHGQVYKPSKNPCTESSTIKPWTKHANYKYQAEEALRAMVKDGLPLVVLRLATVYGKADVNGLMPRVVIAAAYKKLNEKMKFLWGKSLNIATVHVNDVIRAIWHVSGDAGVIGSTYNVADKGNTNQGMVCDMLSNLFGIEVGYHGMLISNAARLKMDYACSTANEKHLTPWNDLITEFGINTNLSPYLDREVLGDKHLSLDGSFIESTGFEYLHPVLTEEALREQAEYAVAQKTFPPVIVGGSSGSSKSNSGGSGETKQ
jgi:nucleoside-diphosphate-sugar epimerase